MMGVILWMALRIVGASLMFASGWYAHDHWTDMNRIVLISMVIFVGGIGNAMLQIGVIGEDRQRKADPFRYRR